MKPLLEDTKFRIQLSLTLIIVLMTPVAAQVLDWVLKGCHVKDLPNGASVLAELIFFILGWILMLDTYSYIIKEEEKIYGPRRD